MTVYQEYGVPDGLRAFGRCIGHGGMPVDLPPHHPTHRECEVEFVDRRHYLNDENLTIGYNGFARMTLRGDCATVEYVDLEGTVIFTEAWKVAGGVLQRVGASAGEKK